MDEVLYTYGRGKVYLWMRRYGVHGVLLTKLPYPISCMRNGVYTDGMRCTYERSTVQLWLRRYGVFIEELVKATVYVYG